MAEQHRRGYDSDFQQRGSGWSDRHEWRSRDADYGHSRSYEAGPDDVDRARGWRDESDRYAQGDESGRRYERPWSGDRDDQSGRYSGRHYGGVSSYGRGYSEGDFMSNRGGSSRGGSEPRFGGDWRMRGEWPNEPDDRGSDAPFWAETTPGFASGGRGYEPSNPAARYTSERAWPRDARRAESYGGTTRRVSGGHNSGTAWYPGGTAGHGPGYRESYVGRGPKDYKRSNERIREDVSDRLAQDAFVDASDITVNVHDCEVTLSGTVGTRDQKHAAEDCVEAVSGVRDVHNELRVNRQDGPPSSSLLGLGGQPARDAPAPSASAESMKRQNKNTPGVADK